MQQRSYELREAAFLTLTYVHSAVKMGRIAAQIGVMFPDAAKKHVQKAAESVFLAATCASQAMLALSKDDITLARQASSNAHGAEKAVMAATQDALLAVTSALREARDKPAETAVPDMEGILALWDSLRSFQPDPFTPPPSPLDDE